MPNRPDAAAADRLLVKVVDQALAEATRRAGAHLACRIGCTECCMGPFPINVLDARRLRRAMEILPPETAARVRARAKAAVELMRPFFPGHNGIFEGGAASEEEFATRFAALPCPALDPQSGACDLYAARPLACRTYGLPVHLGGADLPPCRLCFTAAGAGEIEAARAVIDPDGIEELLLDAETSPDAMTTVAFAILQ